MMRLLLRREILLRWQNPVPLFVNVLFFVLLLVVPALLMAQKPQVLQQMSAAVVWLAVLLASQAGVDTLFQRDIDSGWLSQVFCGVNGRVTYVYAKFVAHLLAVGVPIGVLCWLVILFYGQTFAATTVLFVTVLLAMPVLLLLNMLAGALTLSIPSAQFLVPFIAIPLQLPMVLFANGALLLHTEGGNILPICALMLAVLLTGLLVLPWLIAKILMLVWDES